jgi:GT2 family glycosyltransferase
MKNSVWAVVLNYNNANDTIACIRSLQACNYASLRIVVVDNGSQDNSEEILRSTFIRDEIVVLQTGNNLGFAGGNNYGYNFIKTKKPSYVLFINNDTLVEPGFMENLVDALERDPQAGAAGGLICYYPEKNQIWYAGGDYHPLRASSFVSHFNDHTSKCSENNIRVVTFITGCMIMIKMEVLAQTGPFDDRFFMYVEDTEICLRINSMGYRLLFVPSAKIYHKIKHRNKGYVPLYYNVRNRLLLVSITRDGWKALFPLLYVFCTTSIKILLWTIVTPKKAQAALWGMMDYFTGNYYQGRGNLLKKTEGM